MGVALIALQFADFRAVGPRPRRYRARPGSGGGGADGRNWRAHRLSAGICKRGGRVGPVPLGGLAMASARRE